MSKALSGNRWPHLVVLIGLLFIGLTGWSVFRAATGVSAISDSHYYSHGLRYNDTLFETRAAESLGWKLTVTLREGYLESSLTGKDGSPVSAGKGRLLIHAGAGIDLPLRETAPGIYSASLPPKLQGETGALLSFSRDGATLRRPLLLNL